MTGDEKRAVPDHILSGAIVLLRDSFRRDGAEGETVHLVCDAVEALWARNAELEATVEEATRHAWGIAEVLGGASEARRAWEKKVRASSKIQKKQSEAFLAWAKEVPEPSVTILASSEPPERTPEDVVHAATLPFTAACGADEPNQATTNLRENVTCEACLALKPKSTPAEVDRALEAMEREVDAILRGEGTEKE